MAAAPTSLSPRLAPAVEQRPSALHVVASRAAAVRLAPVVEALEELGAVQSVVAPGVEGFLAPARVTELAAREPAEIAPVAVAAAVEAAIARSAPDTVLVAGDGDAALASALVAERLGVRIARLGAGARCGDRTVPEEVNRIALDGLADRLYADDDAAVRRLIAEGLDERRIRRVGNTLAGLVERRRAAAAARAAWRAFDLRAGGYVLVHLRRPENLRDDVRVARITESLYRLAGSTPVVMTVDDRTRAAFEPCGDLIRLLGAGVRIVGPLPHLDFLSLESAAGAVLTDSAAVQDETTVLGIACFTLRRSTERTATLTEGTNALLGDDPDDIRDVVPGPPPEVARPIPLWDGAAGRRVAEDLLEAA